MSGSVNKAIVVGHLGGDPKIRATQGGAKVAELSVATGKSWRDKATGERRQSTEWHRVVVFVEGLVKVVEQYTKKGSKLYVEGEMRTRKWTDNAGVERFTTEIVIGQFGGQIVLLDRREGVAPAASEDDYGGNQAGGGAPPPDDEVPF
jgi:single-strand DNA-binding protein